MSIPSWLPLAVVLAFGALARLPHLNAPPVPIFDEGLFYLPAARAYLQGLPDPTFEHPPLGKEAIALGIALLGDNPWGWRALSAIAGVVGIALTYRLTWLLWRSHEIAFLAAGLLSLDFLWLSFSRLAMLDIFQAVLVLAALVAAWSYRTKGGHASLLACGLALGLATAVKWSGAWALLPILLALAPTHERPLTREQTISAAALFFAAGALGYGAPWLYHVVALGYGPGEIIGLHQQMLGYQLQVGADRLSTAERLLAPLAWFTGSPLVFTAREDRSVGVLVTSNPLILLPGFLSVLWLLKRGLTAFRSPEGFLAVAFLSLYLPWFLLPRLKYFYYLLPGMPLLAIALAYCYYRLWQTAAQLTGRRRSLAISSLMAFLAVTAALFVGAFPALSGYWSRP